MEILEKRIDSIIPPPQQSKDIVYLSLIIIIFIGYSILKKVIPLLIKKTHDDPIENIQKTLDELKLKLEDVPTKESVKELREKLNNMPDAEDLEHMIRNEVENNRIVKMLEKAVDLNTQRVESIDRHRVEDSVIIKHIRESHSQLAGRMDSITSIVSHSSENLAGYAAKLDAVVQIMKDR